MQIFIIVIEPFAPGKVGNLPKVFPSHILGSTTDAFNVLLNFSVVPSQQEESALFFFPSSNF